MMDMMELTSLTGISGSVLKVGEGRKSTTGLVPAAGQVESGGEKRDHLKQLKMSVEIARWKVQNEI